MRKPMFVLRFVRLVPVLILGLGSAGLAAWAAQVTPSVTPPVAAKAAVTGPANGAAIPAAGRPAVSERDSRAAAARSENVPVAQAPSPAQVPPAAQVPPTAVRLKDLVTLEGVRD